jgi:hypothetical protein
MHALGAFGNPTTKESQEEYNQTYDSMKHDFESMKVIVNDKNKQVDGAYIAVITYWVDNVSYTEKIGFLKGADGLVITCYNTGDGSKNCK